MRYATVKRKSKKFDFWGASRNGGTVMDGPAIPPVPGVGVGVPRVLILTADARLASDNNRLWLVTSTEESGSFEWAYSWHSIGLIIIIFYLSVVSAI